MRQRFNQAPLLTTSPLVMIGVAAVAGVAGALLAPSPASLGMVVLALLLAGVCGWRHGVRRGLACAGLILALHMLLTTLLEHRGLWAAISSANSVLLIAGLLASAAVGWVGSLYARLAEQASALEHERSLRSAETQRRQQVVSALRESEARFRTLIQDLHVGVLIQGTSGEAVLANPAALELLGLSEEQLYARSAFARDWNAIRLDGTPFPNSAHPTLQAIITGQPVRDVVMGMSRPSQGDHAWLLVSAEPQLDAYGHVQHVICTCFDISSRVRAEQALQRHDAIMGAVSYAAACFLAASRWQDVIGPVLERLGVAAAVSRVSIVENQPAASAAGSDQQLEWLAPQLAPSELPRFGQQASSFARWAEALSLGQLIYGSAESFPGAERELLERHQIYSIVVVPVIAGQHWWGQISFEQRDAPREWSASDLDALNVAASILGATIERERAEATLRENEQRYRNLSAAARRQAKDLQLLDQLRSALARAIDLGSIARICVEAIAETLGYTQVSLYLIEGDMLQLQHQVGYDHVIASISLADGVAGRVARTGEPVLLRNVGDEPSFIGAIADITSEICVPLFEQGRVAGILNIESSHGERLSEADLRLMLALSDHLNIAIERAALYQQVRESERQYRSVVDTIREVVFQIAPSGAWTFLNPAWTEITEYTVEQTLGRCCADFVYPDDLAQFEHSRVALMAHEFTDWRQELRLRTRGGLVRWVELFARPAYDVGGELLGLAGTLIDVTARRRAEEERRTIEHKMLEAQKLESLGVLAGGIAHDFNNLLMAIMGNAELGLLDLPSEHPARESLAQIQLTTRRAADLTSQMLAYAGKGRFVVQQFDLNLLVEEITALLQVSISKTTNLRYSLSAQLPLIAGDLTQVRQVVMNLVINAAEAIGDQRGLITLSTGLREVDASFRSTLRLAADLPLGTYVFLDVNDNGVGMSEETLSKIFDPFFTTKFTGRGLGLAAVLGIVRAHHGALRVRSTLGQGTTFSILFPVQVAEQPPAAPPELPASARVPLAFVHHTVLVIDDEIGVRTVTVNLLERAGFKVLAAADGYLGLEIFTTQVHAISAVLLDLTMPNMSGEAVLRAMRAIRPDLRVLVISGYDEYDLASRFAGLEPVEFLQKPFTGQMLYEKLAQMQLRAYH